MLVTKHCQIDTSKLQVKCKGPHRIVSVDSDYVCVCVCVWRGEFAHEGTRGRARNTPEILSG
jgi:hypothetical protein